MVIKIFIAGDLHIPARAVMLHPDFQMILEQEKWDYIILTGDLTTEEVLNRFYEYVKSSERVLACRGNVDQVELPLEIRTEINGIPIGVFHGIGISPRGDIKQLKRYAEEKQIRILCTGHSHQTLLYSDSNHLILNPGTSTGATGGSSWSVDTGLITLEIDDENKSIIVMLYQMNQRNKMKSEKQIINLEK
ncbi:MAG: YfcE family phosphodiesterase [Candidatus Thorarchaeota archaeon]